MILSKNSGNALVNFAGVSFATKTFGIPKSSRLRRRALAREVLISFATRSHCPRSAAPAAVALPPGAAQRSRTLSPGSRGMREAGVMALGSGR